MIKCQACGLVYDPDTSVDEECPQCKLREIRASNGMEISRLKNKIFQLKLKLGCAK
jgi:rubredoxin